MNVPTGSSSSKASPHVLERSASMSRYSARRGILPQLNSEHFELPDLPDDLQPCFEGPTSRFEPLNFRNGQVHPFLRGSKPQEGHCEISDQLFRPVRGQNAPQDRLNSLLPTHDGQDPYETKGITVPFEELAHGLARFQRLDTFQENGNGQSMLRNRVASATCDQDADTANRNKDIETKGPPAKDISANSFRAVTVDDEEGRRQMLGTIMDTDNPEIPELCLNNHNYVSHRGGSAQYRGNDDRLGHNRSGKIWDKQNTTEGSNRAPSRGSSGQDDAQPVAGSIEFEMDVLSSQSLTPDIVRQLGYMPVSCMDAFLYGDDAVQLNDGDSAGYEGPPANIFDNQLNMLEGNHLLEGYAANSGILGNSQDDNLEEVQKDPPDVQDEASTSHACPPPPEQMIGSDMHQNLCERDLTTRRESATWHSDPFSGEHEDADLEDSPMQDGGYEFGAPSNHGEFDNTQVMENDGTILTNQVSLSDITNLQTDGQQTADDSIDGRVPFRLASANEIWRTMREFSKKVRKQRYSKGNRLANVRYYSLKRMERDLSDNLAISQQLLVAFLRLREERRKLEQDCQKEREEIKRLRDSLGL